MPLTTREESPASKASPEFRAESRAGEVYTVHVIFFVLSLLAVCARLASARVSRRKLSWDDWLAVAAEVFIVGVFTGTMMWLRFGLGRHEIVVVEEDPLNITRFFQTIYANEIMYPLGLASARMSLVILYHRIFGLFSARYWLYGLIAFIGAWGLYATIPTIVACIPVSNFWTTHKNCLDLSSLYISIAVGSIVSDFVLIIIPMPYAARLRMSLPKKVFLLASFVFGGFNCFITIIRLVKVSNFDYGDPTWGTVDLMIWTGLEAYCGVICCCLPTLRPLFHFYRSDRKDRRHSDDEAKKAVDRSTAEGTLTQLSVDPQALRDYLPKPPHAASRSPEETMKDYSFISISLIDLRQYARSTKSESIRESNSRQQ